MTFLPDSITFTLGPLSLSFQNVTVWLGGLFNPEAYITATRQCVAQANSWSLEELTMEVSIADAEGQVTAAGGFNIKGERTRLAFYFQLM